ncbi:hypothetical protein L1987_24154 [Smallanthus sonchifolius]|uniref:Uncharacterized protein n=1 Tax=Smallanthus sonchifolius TaxID=185202 RepID=A0ACB9IK86_9ASTR|nr:hypothetical protein L1987_24154 [Smallanthus sonchifolius]
MALTRELFHNFRGYDNSKDLWKPLQKRFEGNSDIKKSKRDLLMEEAIGKVQAHNMNLRKKESSGRPQIQDPSMYHGTSSTTKSSCSGFALFSGNSTEEDHSNGCGGHTCYASGLGSGSHQHHTSRNPPSKTSANQ